MCCSQSRADEKRGECGVRASVAGNGRAFSLVSRLNSLVSRLVSLVSRLDSLVSRLEFQGAVELFLWVEKTQS